MTMTHLCDAHTHLVTEEDINERIQHKVTSLVCNSTLGEINAFLSVDFHLFSFLPVESIHGAPTA